MVNGNEDLVELFGTRARLNSRRSYLTACGPRVQAWFGLHKSRRRRQPSVRSPPNCLIPVWNGAGGCSQVLAIQCTVGNPSTYASMTAVTRLPHSSQRRPGSANATRQHVNGLQVLMYVVVDSWAKMIRFDRWTLNVEPPTQFRRPRSFRVSPLIVTFDSSASSTPTWTFHPKNSIKYAIGFVCWS